MKNVKLKVFYIIDLGKIEWQSILFASSFLKFANSDYIDLVAYAPNDRIDQIDETVIKFHQANNIKIEVFENTSPFVSLYPLGNKILASALSKEADYSLFLDTDTLFMKKVDLVGKFCNGNILGRDAPAKPWSKNEDSWQVIAKHFNIELKEAYKFSNGYLPYLNGGVLGFPTRLPNGEYLGESWLRTAIEIDHVIDVTDKRPWLDQVAFATTIMLSNIQVDRLPLDWNFSINSKANKETVGFNTNILHYHGGLKGSTLKLAKLSLFCGVLLKQFSDFESYNHLIEYFALKYPDDPYSRHKFGWTD